MFQHNLESKSSFSSLSYFGLRKEVTHERKSVNTVLEKRVWSDDDDGEEGRSKRKGLVTLDKLHFILRSLNCLKALKQTLHDLIYSFEIKRRV